MLFRRSLPLLVTVAAFVCLFIFFSTGVVPFGQQQQQSGAAARRCPLPSVLSSRTSNSLHRFKGLTLREWQQMLKPTDDLILQASPPDETDNWQIWPIGMAHRFLALYKSSADQQACDVQDPSLQLGPHDRQVFCSFRTWTETAWPTKKRRENATVNRKTIERALASNGIKNVEVNSKVFYHELPRYKFVVSPEGNGIDTHRHYEALLAGAIPIVENNTLVLQKYGLMPILVTTNYSEITVPYLEAKYKEMLDLEYDFSPLFYSFYPLRMRKIIARYGNYWCRRLENRPCYDDAEELLK